MKWRVAMVVAVVFMAGGGVALSLAKWPAGVQLQTDRGLEAIASCDLGLPPVGGEPLPLPLSVVVWNMQKRGGESDGRKELEALARRTDLFLLQEATALLPAPLPSMQQLEAFSYAGESYGVGALASRSLARPCGLLTPEPLLRLPKSALMWRQPLIDGRVLLIINVHSINFDWRLSTYTAWLDALGALVAAHTGPVLLAGDFNTWNDRRLQALNRWASDLGMVEARFEPDNRVRHLGHAVDTVWVRDLRILVTGSAAVSYADHNPLWITVDRQPLAEP